MAKQKRKAQDSKPVTQHQLFPAVVALWFGALFGLGSLAVRPSLIEDLVIKSRIDLLIPAAAPPLGMTARMLIALVMAALGALIGSWIARRLARPRQEVRERKRTTLSTRDEGAGERAHNTYGDASTRNPGPAQEDSGTPGVLSGRRRSLAIEHEVDDFVPHDMAPLPGGAPQIFDIAAAGLNDAPPAPVTTPEPESYFTVDPAQPLAPVALDWASATPEVAPAEPVVEVPPVAAHPPADDRQVFGMTPPAAPPADQPRQIFGAPVADDHVPREFVEAHGFRGSVFDAPEPSPLFALRPEAASLEVAAAPVSEAFTPPFAVAAAAAQPAAEVLPEPPAAPAEPEPALPSPASLGIEDLSARLAESMRRRRAGRTAAVTEPVVSSEVPHAPVAEIPAPPEAPHSVAAGKPEFSVPHFDVPPFIVPPAELPVEVVAAPVVPQPIPAALRPLDLTGFEEGDNTDQDNLLPPRRIAFPVEPAPIAIVPPPLTAVADEPDASDEAAVAEEDYASLLGVAPSPVSLRNPFVRVEEPESIAEAIEPVVIFPGQAMPAPQPFAAPVAASGDEVTPFRRFDSPAAAGQGQPSAANEGANAMPSEEAERALRSALANLQRMSGAA